MEFFQLKVKGTTPETTDAVTIEFDIPEELSDKFVYTQGQYISLRVHIDGHELRRSYSMSSSPSG
jgi:ring-1,2-phenylacetyl-CoA epoxidase subunit PaaE